MKTWAARLALLSTCVLGLTGLAACDAPPQGKVGKTLLAQADDIQPVPQEPGAVTVEFPADPLAELPDATIVHLAIARNTPYSQVQSVLQRLSDAGKTVRILAASRKYVGVFELDEELKGEAIRLWVNQEGKSCVSPPGVEEAKCVKRRGRTRHVDRAFTRQLVREAVAGYQLSDVVVEIPPTLEWADVLRAIDAARTCCKQDSPRARIRVLPPAEIDG